MTITENLKRVQERVQKACIRAGRSPESVKLLAVSKTKTAEMIREVVDQGLLDIGENYVQEFLQKKEQLPENINWHFIGRLQSNKIRQIVGKVKLIHSVDREKLLKEINKRAKNKDIVQHILLEINLGDEDSKGGSNESEINQLMEKALTFDNLKVNGLMSIPPFLKDAEAIRPYHVKLAKIADRLRSEYKLELPVLSMGMSLDMEAAIEEGATIVRVGTDIFGAREYKK